MGVAVGLAFAAAAGVGLAQITSQHSAADVALSTTVHSSSASRESRVADTSSEANDELEVEQSDSKGASGAAPISTSAPQTSTAGGGSQGSGRQKVEICHLTGNGSSHTIDIAAPAVPAHVAHGDTKGACAPTPTTTAAAQPTASAPTSHGNSGHVTHHSSHGNSAHSHHGNGGSHGKGHGK